VFDMTRGYKSKENIPSAFSANGGAKSAKRRPKTRVNCVYIAIAAPPAVSALKRKAGEGKVTREQWRC